MASVELRPGDTLNIVWSSVQETPLGVKEVESSFAFSYDELLSKLRAKAHISKSRKSGTEGAKFSRVVALSTNALKKGIWSTGATIDKEHVFSKLIHKFDSLNKNEYVHITQNAKEALLQLHQEPLLKPDQKIVLLKILKKLNLTESL
jgi:hypothetical protein